jgi:hypothetical protein
LANFAMSGGKGKATLAARFAKVKSAFDKSSEFDDTLARVGASKVTRFDLEAQLEFTVRTLIVGLETSRKLKSRA